MKLLPSATTRHRSIYAHRRRLGNSQYRSRDSRHISLQGQCSASRQGRLCAHIAERGENRRHGRRRHQRLTGLARADVSIAMGQGTDIAMQVAMVTLMNSDLNLLTRAVVLSRSTMRIVRENLFWAFIYNVVCIPVAAGVLFPINGWLLNPMWASAAMHSARYR